MTRRPLAELLPAVAECLGVPGFGHRGDWLADALDGVRQVVVLLVDGLGDEQLRAHPELCGFLSEQLVDLGGLAAPFPSSTCVSLTSLGTGLTPGEHGIVGTSFRLDDGTTLAPLSWGEVPNPIATQPEPTVLERADAAGVIVTSGAPPAYRTSGLTRAALRGGSYRGTSSIADRMEVVRDALLQGVHEDRPSLTYVYWPDLDKVGHVHGTDSGHYRSALRRVDALVGVLAGALVGGQSCLLVTADHGMLDVADDRRVDLEADPTLRAGVVTILGEPRVRHVYCAPGRAEQVAGTWQRSLGSRARVLLRDEAAELLGPVPEWHVDRIGDVVAVARGSWALVSDRVDSRVSALRGQHGGLSADEVNVPLRLVRGA